MVGSHLQTLERAMVQMLCDLHRVTHGRRREHETACHGSNRVLSTIAFFSLSMKYDVHDSTRLHDMHREHGKHAGYAMI